MAFWRWLGYEEPAHGPSWRVLAAYAAASTIGVIVDWLDKGMVESSEIMARWMWDHVVSTAAGAGRPITGEVDAALTPRT